MGLALAVALMGMVDFAEGMSRGFGYGYPAIPNLSAEQSSKIQVLQKAYLEAYLDGIAPLQQDLLKKKTELRSLWLCPTPDQAKITPLQKDILNLQAKITDKATNLRFEIRKVLTPEKQTQMATFGPGMGRNMKMGRMGRW